MYNNNNRLCIQIQNTLLHLDRRGKYTKNSHITYDFTIKAIAQWSESTF